MGVGGWGAWGGGGVIHGVRMSHVVPSTIMDSGILRNLKTNILVLHG